MEPANTENEHKSFTEVLEKGFSEKPIVAFTNSTVSILDFRMTKTI